MLRSLLRSLQCRQIHLAILSIGIAGADGSPEATGLDTSFVSSVVDNGVGDYTLNFYDKAQRDIAVLGIHCATDGKYARVSAVTESSVRVLVKDIATNAAAEGDVNLTLGWHGSRHLF